MLFVFSFDAKLGFFALLLVCVLLRLGLGILVIKPDFTFAQSRMLIS
jgi:hypothetical protein